MNDNKNKKSSRAIKELSKEYICQYVSSATLQSCTFDYSDIDNMEDSNETDCNRR